MAGLLEGRCVCEGYAKILQQALKSVGIDCKLIFGRVEEEGKDYIGESGGHAWNQVKINGTWYNCDLTADAENIKEDKQLKYCLESDATFKNYILDEKHTNKITCEKRYNRVNLELARSNIAEELSEKGFSTLEYKKDEEIEKRAFLLMKGFTKEEAKNFMYEKAMAQSDEEKENVWEKYRFIKLQHIKEAKEQAKPAKEQYHGNLEGAIEYLMNCAEKGESVYLDFNGHRLYSCDISFRKAFIEVTGLTKEEADERNREYFQAESKEEKDNIIKKYENRIKEHSEREKEEEEQDKRIMEKHKMITAKDIKTISKDKNVIEEKGNQNSLEAIERIEKVSEKEEKSITDIE